MGRIVRQAAAVAPVLQDNQLTGAGWLEPSHEAAAGGTAVEADRVGAQAGREGRAEEQSGSCRRELEPERAGAGVEHDGYEPISSLEPRGLGGNGRKGWRVSTGLLTCQRRAHG